MPVRVRLIVGKYPNTSGLAETEPNGSNTLDIEIALLVKDQER